MRALLLTAAVLSASPLVLARPINGCFAADPMAATTSVVSTLCEAPPMQLDGEATDPVDTLASSRDRSTRPLAGVDTRQAAAQTKDCSALRGSHAAETSMLAGIESRMGEVDRRRRRLQSDMRNLRGRGATAGQISPTAARLSSATATLAVLQNEYNTRSSQLTRSLVQLATACDAS